MISLTLVHQQDPLRFDNAIKQRQKDQLIFFYRIQLLEVNLVILYGTQLQDINSYILYRTSTQDQLKYF